MGNKKDPCYGVFNSTSLLYFQATRESFVRTYTGKVIEVYSRYEIYQTYTKQEN